MNLPCRLAWALASLQFTSACSPTFDWREFEPQGSGIVVSFPCRPDRLSRQVSLGTARPLMEMLSCEAGNTTFALAFADMPTPSQVGPALTALREAAASNLGASLAPAKDFTVEGMTPQPEAARLFLAGKLPDGGAVQESIAVFSRGRRVYQASVLGPAPPVSAVDSFFQALKFPS